MKPSCAITRVVRITNNSVFLDGNCVFSSKNDSEDFLREAYKHTEVNYPKFYKMDTLSKYGFLAAEWLLKEKESTDYRPYKKGIILQNHSASLYADIKYQETLSKIPSPALFVYTLPNIVMGEIAIRHQFKGENTFFVTDQFNAVELANYTSILFKDDILSQAIIGYIELNSDKPDILFCLVEKNGNIILNETSLQTFYSRHTN